MTGDLARLLDGLEEAIAERRPYDGPIPQGGILPTLIAELRRRDEALAGVRELHRPVEGSYGDQVCATCLGSNEDLITWPCPTGSVLAAHEQAEEAGA